MVQPLIQKTKDFPQMRKTSFLYQQLDSSSFAQYYKNTQELQRQYLPEPVYDRRPEFIELYWRAWEIAWDHVVTRDGVAHSPYMDEGFDPDTLWLWDSCFMALFTKFAPQVFPGIQTLQNFYVPMFDNGPSALKIHHPDNPPLTAWVEYEHFLMTGDKDRLFKIIVEKQYLQKHFKYLENAQRGILYDYANIAFFVHRHEVGYMWSGIASGMDNTPRGRNDEDSILWVDFISQLCLTAGLISKMAKLLDQAEIASEYDVKYQQLANLINKYYWDEHDGIYYDIYANSPQTHCKVKTPASFWPMLAGICNQTQAQRLVQHASESNTFGGSIPWVSVSRDDRDFESIGHYWRGSVWLPMAYMASKALQSYGYFDLASALAENLLAHMHTTYKNFTPHTIWECYSPTEAKPGSGKNGESLCRPDFCGWSALGPISMFIEYVLGFNKIDAVNRRVEWRKKASGRAGIKRLKFGTITTDIIADGSDIAVKSSGNYTLVVNGQEFAVKAGKQNFHCIASMT